MNTNEFLEELSLYLNELHTIWAFFPSCSAASNFSDIYCGPSEIWWDENRISRSYCSDLIFIEYVSGSMYFFFFNLVSSLISVLLNYLILPIYDSIKILPSFFLFHSKFTHSSWLFSFDFYLKRETPSD